jgi:hypothetical protein
MIIILLIMIVLAMKENHNEFLKLMNDFKALSIDTIGDTTTLKVMHKESMLQLHQLVLDNLAKMNNCGVEFLKIDLEAQTIDVRGLEARLEEYYKAYQEYKLAFNSLSKLMTEYQITNHELYQGMSDRIDNLESKFQHFFDVLPNAMPASNKRISD